MSTTAVEQLVYLLDEAIEGKEGRQQSLLGNLQSVTEDDWLWVPPDGARTIRRITGHIGGAVWLYYDRAFGDNAAFGQPITWNTPVPQLGGHGTLDLDDSPHLDPEPPMADVVAWASDRARTFRDATAALTDEQLTKERADHHDQPRPLRWFIGAMINHFAYHAGEINHIRALHQKNDG